MNIVFVANFTPDTNYTRDLSQGFIKIMKQNDKLHLCGRIGEPVTDGKIPNVDLVWRRGVFFFVPILIYILKKRPHVVHFQHEFKTYGGIISTFLFPWFILILKMLGIKVVVTSHVVISTQLLNQAFFDSFSLRYNHLTRTCAKIFLTYTYNLLVNFSDVLIVHTPFMKKILIDEYNCNFRKLVVIEHGIREIITSPLLPHNPSIKEKFPMLRNNNIMLVFGYLSPRKGLEILIKSFKQLIAGIGKSNWVLVIAGEAAEEFLAYKVKIEKLISKLKIEKSVCLTGFVNAKEIDELFRMAKISVIPAMFSISTSGALSLSLAYKKPLLVANVNPIADEVRSNNLGRIFENTNSSSFGQEFNRLWSDKYSYSKMIRAIETVATRRYWIVIANEHYSLYRSL